MKKQCDETAAQAPIDDNLERKRPQGVVTAAQTPIENNAAEHNSRSCRYNCSAVNNQLWSVDAAQAPINSLN